MSDFNLSLNGSDARLYIDYLVEQRIEVMRKQQHYSELPIITCRHCVHYDDMAFINGARCTKHSYRKKLENGNISEKEVRVEARDHVCVFFEPSKKFKPIFDKERKKKA